jgi:hypothetical protein
MAKKSKTARDNRTKQLKSKPPAHTASNSSTKATADNRSKQLNPKADANDQSRVLPEPELHEAKDEEDDD